MIPLRHAHRLLHISRVLVAYRLDDIIQAVHLYRPVRLLRLVTPARKHTQDLPRGARLRMALDELGPIFVKFGQILSTRRDLLPRDIADELALLQDKVSPFPGNQAIAMIEEALQEPVGELYKSFESEPLASASIAQVHAATMHSGDAVVVKVLRPEVRRWIERDLELLKHIARLAQRYAPDARRLRPREVVAEFERTVYDELDLQREGANYSQLKRNFDGSGLLYVPAVYWSHTKENVLTLERVYGVAVSDIKALKRAGVDMRRLAECGVEIFYTQVFRDNFFHADMHPGNILVDTSTPEDPGYIALDLGIMGVLTDEDQRYLADNFLAFFDQDYKRVAELHVDSGWVPPGTKVAEFESAIRTVCEPNFAKPLSEISFGEVLLKLFRVARRFDMHIQPQLLLLQKTLLNIEGLGRELYPQLDLWTTAKPVLERIIAEQRGITGTVREARRRLPIWINRFPELPELCHDYLRQATSGTLRYQLDPESLQPIRAEIGAYGHRVAAALIAAGLLPVCALIVLFAPATLLSYLTAGAAAAGAVLLAWIALARR